MISGNIISTISDHYAQFLLQKDMKINKNKPNLFGHNFKNLNEASFDFELRQTDWKTILEIDKKEIDFSKKLRKKLNKVWQRIIVENS